MDIETIFTTPLNDVFTNRDTAYSVLGNRMINSHKRYLVAQGFLAVPPRLNLFRQLMDDMIKAAFSQPKPAAPRVGTGAAQNNNVSESDRLAQLFLTTASPTVRFYALLEAQAKTRITRAGRLTVMDDVAAKSSAKWDLLQEWCENKFWTGPLYHRIHPPHVGNTMCGGRWSHEPGWYCCWVRDGRYRGENRASPVNEALSVRPEVRVCPLSVCEVRTRQLRLTAVAWQHAAKSRGAICMTRIR